MAQKAPKEMIPKLLSELVGMEQNLETLGLMEKFLSAVTIPGSEAMDLSRCQHWVKGMKQGSVSRIAELKAQLPEKDMEIKLGPEETPAETPEQPSAPSQEPAGDPPVVPPADAPAEAPQLAAV